MAQPSRSQRRTIGRLKPTELQQSPLLSGKAQWQDHREIPMARAGEELQHVRKEDPHVQATKYADVQEFVLGGEDEGEPSDKEGGMHKKVNAIALRPEDAQEWHLECPDRRGVPGDSPQPLPNAAKP
eukprot:CAMPEP_0115738372 /NCGR_PEP_ID=MMETSP0272-20121206/88348_1 /TAXON_ID=71861 /ORGANISM="Scrippsiella trochoidea, Strain CCMP3099" /LENGTH=126 /DNA_ID=CAMNT_0003182801 /DNA_START=422 /DNA_END=803 /DNA_ORIENTATION=+